MNRPRRATAIALHALLIPLALIWIMPLWLMFTYATLPESEFFQVSGTGGTVASTGFAKVREVIDARYNPGRCNIYLFYASDGDNSVSDSADARESLSSIAGDACYTGYVEVSSGLSRQLATETGRLFAELSAAGCAAGSYALNDFDDVWGAVRHFFTAESNAPEGP